MIKWDEKQLTNSIMPFIQTNYSTSTHVLMTSTSQISSRIAYVYEPGVRNMYLYDLPPAGSDWHYRPRVGTDLWSPSAGVEGVNYSWVIEANNWVLYEDGSNNPVFTDSGFVPIMNPLVESSWQQHPIMFFFSEQGEWHLEAPEHGGYYDTTIRISGNPSTLIYVTAFFSGHPPIYNYFGNDAIERESIGSIII